MPTRLIVSATGSVPAQACRAVRPSTHSAEANMMLLSPVPPGYAKR